MKAEKNETSLSDEKIIRLADEVLDLSRNRLLVNLRYLDTALTFHSRAVYDGSLSTDGKRLLFDPLYVLRSFRDSKSELCRTLLHTVLHCIFHHPFTGRNIDGDLWDLACDIAVESTVNELGLNCVSSDRSWKQEYISGQIRRAAGFLTAEKIYSYLRTSCADSKDIREWTDLFRNDEHSGWYTEYPDDPASSSHSILPSGIPDPSITVSWKEIAEHVQMELEFFAKVRGKQASSLIQNLRAVNREKYDYSSFLRQFASSHEEMKVSDDEFDYIYYNYGLSRYGNLPLIEPLEYRDSSRIHDFVIAIDTSGSVAGNEIQSFIEKTFNILSERDSFDHKTNIHIIQCDAEIQSDTVITGRQDLDIYIRDMEIKGLGGTDFRPVFTYVNDLISRGTFSDLRGLIYFTDGLGYYPEKMPDFRTAFVFIENGYNIPEVPPWAVKLILRSDDIEKIV